MQLQKKQVRKEDGRYLVYYHSPQSATPEQAVAFAAIETPAKEISAPPAVTSRREESERV